MKTEYTERQLAELVQASRGHKAIMLGSEGMVIDRARLARILRLPKRTGPRTFMLTTGVDHDGPAGLHVRWATGRLVLYPGTLTSRLRARRCANKFTPAEIYP